MASAQLPLTTHSTTGRFQRQQSGPWSLAGVPLPAGNEVWLQTHSPGEVRFPGNCRAQAAPRPLSLSSPSTLGVGILSSLKATSPDVAPAPNKGVQPQPCPVLLGPLEPRGSCQETGQASPGG